MIVILEYFHSVAKDVNTQKLSIVSTVYKVQAKVTAWHVLEIYACLELSGSLDVLVYTRVCSFNSLPTIINILKKQKPCTKV